jgi:hypothetical protein
MQRMSGALWELAKSYFARPKKVEPVQLNWVKANKPLGEMSVDERMEFYETLTDSMMKQINPKNK